VIKSFPIDLSDIVRDGDSVDLRIPHDEFEIVGVGCDGKVAELYIIAAKSEGSSAIRLWFYGSGNDIKPDTVSFGEYVGTFRIGGTSDGLPGVEYHVFSSKPLELNDA
jgi:hypothetical protein